VVARLTGSSNGSESRKLDDTSESWIAKVVDDLKAAEGRSLVVVGREQPAAIHAIAHTINEHLGSVGKTIHFIQSPQVRPIVRRQTWQCWRR